MSDSAKKDYTKPPMIETPTASHDWPGHLAELESDGKGEEKSGVENDGSPLVESGSEDNHNAE